ncbi:MAG: acetyl-CoA carboxylase biotin carboxyl carrier protein subunit [Ardenticatenia bacterium]|nr:acetyl-CoA carboxylase biotin carboxyl carrier protein subunit [Ardenticatenia bacterium]
MIEVKAMMVGVVVRVDAGPGTPVDEDQPIVTLESMKMELPIPSPRSGLVREVRVHVGDVVQEGDVVALLEEREG